MGISAVVAAVGIGVGAAGLGTSISGSQDYQAAQQREIAAQMAVSAQQKKAADLDNRRRILESIRQQQVARSMSLAAATAQGAGLGSGLLGGYAQISGDATTSRLGIYQNAMIGKAIFGYNQQISDARISESNAQGTMAIGQGLMGFGSSLVSASSNIGKLTAGNNFGSTSNMFGYGNSYAGPTSYNPSIPGSLY